MSFLVLIGPLLKESMKLIWILRSDVKTMIYRKFMIYMNLDGFRCLSSRYQKEHWSIWGFHVSRLQILIRILHGLSSGLNVFYR